MAQAALLWGPSSVVRRSRHRGRGSGCGRRKTRWLTKAEREGQEGDDEGPPSLPTDWREFRARLIASERGDSSEAAISWAHPLTSPEQGCILIARPTVDFGLQAYFNKAVIFILEHSGMGTVGVIVNRRASSKIGDVASDEDPLQDSDIPLWFGGDVGRSQTLVLHSKITSECMTIVDGVYLSNLNELSSALDRGELSQGDFKVFIGYCGWAPGQLEQELENDVWFVGACSADVPFRHTDDHEDHWWQIIRLLGGKIAEEADEYSS